VNVTLSARQLTVLRMGTRNIRLMDAIESIDQGYRGKEGWASIYKKTRRDWIEELKVDWVEVALLEA
jgi:hypothetical protein